MTKVKDYVFYPPKNPQFFFPKKEFKQFQQYYSPYSLKSKMFWLIYQKSKLIRSVFTITEKDIPLPIQKIKSILKPQNNHYTCFYNLGTKGEEQKATVIASSNNQKLFLKFAEKQKAKELVKNEIEILQELQEQTTITAPKLIDCVSNNNFTALVTEVISGKKMTDINLSDEVIKLLFDLPKLKPIEYTKNIKTFAHGDFCPWNMIVNDNGELLLVDWEMAGFKPLGYDLFTYLFQTNFLLNPKITPQQIIYLNKTKINTFFKTFGVSSWNSYLTKFATLKIETEQAKKNSTLLIKYKQLLQLDDKN